MGIQSGGYHPTIGSQPPLKYWAMLCAIRRVWLDVPYPDVVEVNGFNLGRTTTYTTRARRETYLPITQHGRQQMSDLDDLVAALIKGDPSETVPLEIVTAMAQAAINTGWQPHYWICKHEWQPTNHGWYICWRCESQKRGNDA
jgi:hypothetical protein